MAAVPAAFQQAADRAVRADVVRDEAAVRLGALPPGADVVDDPVAVALLAGEDPGVEDQPGHGEVDRGVADADALAHLRPESRVRRERVRAVLRLGEPFERVAVGVGLLLQPRVDVAVGHALPVRVTAVVRTGDDAVGGVVVAVDRVDVQVGEPQGALGPALGVGHAQEVEQEQALALVEPVVAALVLVAEHVQFGEVRGDPLPVLPAGVQEVVGAAEEVQLRPVEEDLVEVVHAVTGGQPAGVVQPAVGAGEVAGEAAPAVVEQVEQGALRHRPAGRFQQRHPGPDLGGGRRGVLARGTVGGAGGHGEDLRSG